MATANLLRRIWVLVAVLAAVAVPLTTAARDFAPVTRIWTVSDLYWKAGSATFPEAERPTKPADLGVAFSGGGTRAAAATLGDLRGLRENGWLDNVGYLSAVSGGSWAAVPFTFTDRGGDPRLLGPQPTFKWLAGTEMASALDGSLAKAIADSRFITFASFEVSRKLDLVPRNYLKTATGLACCEYGDVDHTTYTRLLSSIFLKNTTKVSPTQLVVWDEAQLEETLAVNPSLTRDNFVLPGRGRPFLIVNATVIREADGRRLFEPIEMTPYYTGMRRFRHGLGGTYVWTWAFNSNGAVATYPGGQFLRLSAPVGHRGLGLGDMMASSGAAPLLPILTLMPGDTALRMASYFPHFSHVAVHDGHPVTSVRSVLHGDGGFLDNLGVMPLLARQVHQLLVFINTKDPLSNNNDLKAYFHPVTEAPQNGRKTENVVFEDYRYDEVVAGLRAKVRAGRGAAYCGKDWKVLANEVYNIQAYDGVNVCFVYNYGPEGWWKQLPDKLQKQVPKPSESVFAGETEPAKVESDFKHFPWYKTFLENTPTLVDLTPPQVHLLAHLACWTLQDQKDYIEEHLGKALP